MTLKPSFADAVRLIYVEALHIDALNCDGPPEPLWLQAQAVPSASLIPCVRALPTGWTLRDVVLVRVDDRAYLRCGR